MFEAACKSNAQSVAYFVII